jgi:hypothetical protein
MWLKEGDDARFPIRVGSLAHGPCTITLLARRELSAFHQLHEAKLAAELAQKVGAHNTINYESLNPSASGKTMYSTAHSQVWAARGIQIRMSASETTWLRDFVDTISIRKPCAIPFLPVIPLVKASHLMVCCHARIYLTPRFQTKRTCLSKRVTSPSLPIPVKSIALHSSYAISISSLFLPSSLFLTATQHARSLPHSFLSSS